MSINSQMESVIAKFFPIESVIAEFFENHLWGRPKEVYKFALQHLKNKYSKDSIRRLIYRELKKNCVKHPYLPFYFKREYDLQIFNVILRLGWFNVAFNSKIKK